jgi:hypothetical protein
MARRPRQRGSIIGGLLLMAVGGWFLAARLGYHLPGLDTLWPIFPTLAGLAFIISFLTGREREPGILVPGVGAFLSGLFFLLFTVGPLRWSDMSDWWPIFPLIGAVAFLAVWAGTRPRDHSLLVPAGLGAGVGVAGLLVTVAGLRLRLLWQAWPVALILVGLWVLVSGFGAGAGRDRSR